MESRPFEVTLISAKDLKDVNLFTKMDVYATVTIKGDPHKKQKQKTPVHRDSGPNPRWNYTMKFTLDEDSLQKDRLTLKIKVKSDRSLGDRPIGHVRVPLKELLEVKDKEQKQVSYSVRLPSGKNKGTVVFTFKFGDVYSAPLPEKAKKVEEPVTAYPAAAAAPAGYPGVAGSSGAAYPAPGGYPPQPAYGYAYPQQAGYPPPPQQAYAGYPPQPGYPYPGYPPQQPGYGGYPMMQQPPKKSGGGGKMALGLGAGLLGGLLVGDMISDVGDAAAYDAGYDAGFDDGFDF
ncbi:hypothetical protein Tsubulata_042179 [Turnera subulata]|uniref:C2 domain-containing protein n=1 Tax=Turnera subulata TaxID=218843 RepID=A0A9Q0GAT6_9ROSI|nr:hypothetical protein Tsubulata_042179 [Turnera subulata]